MRPNDFSFILRWTLFSLAGTALGGVLGWLLLGLYLRLLGSGGAVELLSVLILMPSVGLGLGLGQALLLDRYIPRPIWWALVTMLGWLLGLSVDFLASRIGIHARWLAYGLGGIYLGGLQWLVLYIAGLHRRAPLSALWIANCLLAWLLVYPAQLALSGPIQSFTQQALGGAAGAVLTWAVAGLVVGLLTAPLMAFLMRRWSSPLPEAQF